LRGPGSRGHNGSFAVRPRSSGPLRFASLPPAALVVLAVTLSRAPAARAADGACTEVSYTFQPDCYHADGAAACKQTLEHLDFGPQIAVWVETAQHALVDTLMVTNLTAARGIGNRPGVWNFRSGPKFPYGKRWMSLPLWAFARGKLYDSVVMQDNREDWMGFHESHSSREPFFCRPVTTQEIALDVDVITCPSQMFNSAKGRPDTADLAKARNTPLIKSYYPPRNDLVSFINQDCDEVGAMLPTCAMSANRYGALNDLDAVASATPPYGQAYARTWRIPAGLPAGDYAIAVEVNKEYDANAAHAHPSFQDPNLQTYGIDGNFGQPSVLYRVPIHLGGATPISAAASDIVGYSKWTAGQPLDGTLLPKDATISTNAPGSGVARLLLIDGPSGKGRVHVALGRCPAVVSCDGGDCPPADDGGADTVDEAGAPGDLDAGDGADVDAGVDLAAPADAVEVMSKPMSAPGDCSPAPAPPLAVTGLMSTTKSATDASFEFVQTSASGDPVTRNVVHYREGSLTEAEFDGANDVFVNQPGPPGTRGTFDIKGLKPTTKYVVGVRALDHCGQHSPLATATFTTDVMNFTQLSGCFIATAAWGSALEPHVEALRRARDRLRPASPIFAAATDLYYRAGPAAAAVVGRSEVVKALARRVLGPLAGLAEAADAAAGGSRTPANPPSGASPRSPP
jgi:hypothetical protein